MLTMLNETTDCVCFVHCSLCSGQMVYSVETVQLLFNTYKQQGADGNRSDYSLNALSGKHWVTAIRYSRKIINYYYYKYGLMLSFNAFLFSVILFSTSCLDKKKVKFQILTPF